MCTMAAREHRVAAGRRSVRVLQREQRDRRHDSAGEVRSAGALGTKENPVTTPPAPSVISAVACCHCGLDAGGTIEHLQSG